MVQILVHLISVFLEITMEELPNNILYILCRKVILLKWSLWLKIILILYWKVECFHCIFQNIFFTCQRIIVLIKVFL